MLNSVVKISMMSAKYFEYYTLYLGGRFFADTLYTMLHYASYVSLFPQHNGL